MPILTYKTQPDGLLVHSERGRLMLTVYSSVARSGCATPNDPNSATSPA